MSFGKQYNAPRVPQLIDPQFPRRDLQLSDPQLQGSDFGGKGMRAQKRK